MHRDGWLGVVGSHGSGREKHVGKLDHQMDSNKVLLCLKYHKISQINGHKTTIVNHLPVYISVPACSRPQWPFQGHPSTIVCLTCLRKQLKQKQPCLLLVVCQWWLVSL